MARTHEREVRHRPRLGLLRVAAWSLSGLAFALLAAALGLIVAGRSTPPPAPYPDWVAQAVASLGFLGFPLLGGYIAAAQPWNRYAWVLSAFGLTNSALAFGVAYTAHELAHPGVLPTLEIVEFFSAISWLATVSVISFLLLLFPNGGLPSRRWLPLVWIIAVAATVGAFFAVSMPDYSVYSDDPAPSPMLLDIAVFTLFGAFLLSFVSLLLRYRRAGAVERQQIKWFLYAGLVIVVSMIVAGFLVQLPGVWDSVLETLPWVGLQIAVGIAVLKYRLYDIDVVISKTVVFAGLAAFITGIYVAIVVGVGSLLG
ncbi:MAG: hypothetical protein M3O70_22595, partial [Actinomycetota bacterium]|nr:hypothetical protein [Actinomycetota bacterium]